MSASASRFGCFILALIGFMSPQFARAIIVFENPGLLTTMPTLPGGVNPGWQYMGTYGSFAGTPIGPRTWLTAKHLTGSTPGTAATLNYNNSGQTGTISYSSTLLSTISDLAIMTLDSNQPSFTSWAPIWSDSTSLVTGLNLYTFGHGTNRGSAVTGGWAWGSANGALSYGTNNIDSFAIDPNYSGNSGLNNLLLMDFNQPTVQNGLPNTEGIFSVGDSGGSTFAYNATHGRWELVGINSYVDQILNSSGNPLQYALYDANGYYYKDALNQLVQINYPFPVALSSYATMVTDKYSILAPYTVPEPGTWVMAVIATAGMIGLIYRRSA